MTQLDDLLAQHGDDPDACPTSPRFRRQLLLELRKNLIVRRGVALRVRGRR